MAVISFAGDAKKRTEYAADQARKPVMNTSIIAPVLPSLRVSLNNSVHLHPGPPNGRVSRWDMQASGFLDP